MSTFLRFAAAALACLPGIARAGNMEISPRDLYLIEPLGPNAVVPAAWTANLSALFFYMNEVWPWLIGVAAGIGVLQVLVAGVQIMFSGSSEKASEGKTRLFWAVAGIMMAAFAGFIFHLLNDIFYI